MSFRDCIVTRQPISCKNAATEAAPQAQAAALPLSPASSCHGEVFHSPRSVVGANETAAEGSASVAVPPESVNSSRDNGEGSTTSELPRGRAGPSQNACCDNGDLLQAAPHRPSSHAASVTASAAASVRSGGIARGSKFSHRIINASAPIAFTKTFCSAGQWGAYTRNPQGYLNAEAVQAAAVAAAAAGDGSFANPKHSTETETSQLYKDTWGNGSVCAAQQARRPSETQREGSAHSPIMPRRISTQTMRNTGEDNNARRGAAGGALQANSSSPVRQSTRTSASTRPILGSWLFGGSGSSTELERLLKEENDIAETAAARSELAATRLLQEDMEAMIANLQQVKTFLVSKLRECETALLTTAQERDDLEATLQQIQGGIQDSVAEHRRQAEECKEKLAHKEKEVEDLRAQLEQATAEAVNLRKENELLKAEVNVARVEAADVAAADGFRIEEYRLALKTLMERDKAQRRELKRLRGQLIKTREDFASALARVDELETLEEFRKSQMNSDETAAAAAAQQTSPWSGRSTGDPQRSPEGPGGHSSSSATPPDECSAPASRQKHTDVQTDGGEECSVSSRDADSARRRSEDASGTSCQPSCKDRNSDKPSSPSGRVLGRSVKGFLASGVTQLLQRIENVISTDREHPELSTDRESQASADTPPEVERSLHEEAELFLQRTLPNSDLIVHLEGGQDGESEEDDTAFSQEGDAGTLKNVARSVWQAAHELLADRAMPPARLSTLRTVAAGNPSAWEVLRERHRAAKSMPLFSSIPPAAYPLMTQASESPQGWRSTTGGKMGSGPSSSSRAATVSRRRGHAGAASPGALNLRSLGRTERGRKSASPQACMTVELPSEVPVCSSEVHSDVAEDLEGSGEPPAGTQQETPPARETDAETPTATEHGAAPGAAQEKMQQPSTPSEAADEPEANGGCPETPKPKESDDAAQPEAADAAAEGPPLKDDGV
ncbi:uncharacterized protein EMH_0076350 [Eimeria mitis]|uniref:Uncharacterized protein n=1 Tax=Eimeria mitis TaxID=44415 RepID=U6JN17_9EIME|nr:uncharacterized protein EMH_0076350 [Eimeria mitis]CDJ26899.1 hypothetical protein, conserved [Eimeria mitis]